MKKHNKNKMISDMGSVPDLKQKIHYVFIFFSKDIAEMSGCFDHNMVNNG